MWHSRLDNESGQLLAQLTWKKKLEVKDVLPKINCTQATEGPKNAVFVPSNLDL